MSFLCYVKQDDLVNALVLKVGIDNSGTMCGDIIIHQDKFLANCNGIWRKSLIPISLAIYSSILKHVEVCASIVRDTGPNYNWLSKLLVLRYATLLESLVSLSPENTGDTAIAPHRIPQLHHTGYHNCNMGDIAIAPNDTTVAS